MNEITESKKQKLDTNNAFDNAFDNLTNQEILEIMKDYDKTLYYIIHQKISDYKTLLNSLKKPTSLIEYTNKMKNVDIEQLLSIQNKLMANIVKINALDSTKFQTKQMLLDECEQSLNDVKLKLQKYNENNIDECKYTKIYQPIIDKLEHDLKLVNEEGEQHWERKRKYIMYHFEKHYKDKAKQHYINEYTICDCSGYGCGYGYGSCPSTCNKNNKNVPISFDVMLKLLYPLYIDKTITKYNDANVYKCELKYYDTIDANVLRYIHVYYEMIVYYDDRPTTNFVKSLV